MENEDDIDFYLHYTYEDLVIVDIEHGPSRQMLESAEFRGKKIVVIGGVGFSIHDKQAIDELVDLQIYQGPEINSVTRAANVTVSNHLIGAEYMIVNPIYREMREQADEQVRRGVLVSMGGSDPHNLAPLVVENLLQMNTGGPIGVVVGPGARDEDIDRVYLYRSPDNLAKLMSQSKYLITALGMTVYEALCLGIPVACTAWSKDHEETARLLWERGYIKYLGLWDSIDWDGLSMFLKWLENSPPESNWHTVVNRGRKLIDGLGVERVADAIERINS